MASLGKGKLPQQQQPVRLLRLFVFSLLTSNVETHLWTGDDQNKLIPQLVQILSTEHDIPLTMTMVFVGFSSNELLGIDQKNSAIKNRRFENKTLKNVKVFVSKLEYQGCASLNIIPKFT